MIGYFTIAHTGTQFFRRWFFADAGLGWKDLGPMRLAKMWCLLTANCATARRLPPFNSEIVTTVRNPLHVAVSWYARGKLQQGYERFIEAWKIWAESVRPRATMLSLDAQNSLAAANAKFGKSATASWDEPMNSETHNSLADHFLRRGEMANLFGLINEDFVREAIAICGEPKYRYWT